MSKWFNVDNQTAHTRTHLAFSDKFFNGRILIVTKLFESSFDLNEQLGTCSGISAHTSTRM